MTLIDRINSLFEAWIDPFGKTGDLKPPKEPLAYFWHYIGQAKLPFLAMLALGGIVALIEAGLFYFVGRLVDLLDSSARAEGWSGLMAAHGRELLFMLATVVIFRFVFAWAAALVEEQTVNMGFYNLVRWQSYAHVARQSLSFFQNDFAGSIAQKVWQSGGAIGDFVVGIVQVVWFMAVYTLTTLILVAQLDWRLAGLVALWVVLFFALARYYVPRMRGYSAAAAENASALSGRIVDSYSNILTLKLFGTADTDDRYVRAGFDRFMDAMRKMTRTVTSLRSAMTLLSGVMIAAIAALSVHLWTLDIVSVGGVAFTLGLLLRLNMLLGRMMNQLNSLMRNFGVAQNAAELISQPLHLVDAPDAVPLTVSKGEIRFENVSFHYGRESGVIDNLDFTIASGERVGIVGRSGAGKSTLVSLLLRFYELEGGRILIDGQDIARVTQESLRTNIGVVTQDTALLHRSVRANLTYGRQDASEEEITSAAELAEAHEFIADLVDFRGRTGYDAHVGERGVKLSGGQRQRVAIARVLLKNAPILVLDEATSALDSEVEAAIQSQLQTLMAGKTVLAIAHRLSTIAAMDRLIILDKGRIIEEGTHAELLKLGGHYAHLWERQSGGFLDPESAAAQ
ncbi:ABC transporter ATP-binding protein [Devosia nitrariae]|uniref:Multidrug ABC transporter ATP-binding protein n=1 Tax=Devosia nitrariae TaxID=2071872 RepID=A0ABQ5W638_9HYPH|nr:ABC transporter ATP-binding protein [Devosia nitrariae]GLQ55075.1 multidrug ABC transporter ATP-binding protein [Devosia nitrariae]